MCRNFTRFHPSAHILEQLTPMLKVPYTPFPWIANGQISGALPIDIQAWGWSERGYKSESPDRPFLSSSYTPDHLHVELRAFLIFKQIY